MLCESALLGWIEPGQEGLNPCSNGRCSARTREIFKRDYDNCLNPCSNGRCSASFKAFNHNNKIDVVLILVLMEDALRDMFTLLFDTAMLVLILVLMEDALRVFTKALTSKSATCLNPCSNGRCSARE